MSFTPSPNDSTRQMQDLPPYLRQMRAAFRKRVGKCRNMQPISIARSRRFEVIPSLESQVKGWRLSPRTH